ncbi:MAG: hypothetical protein WC472_01535 [Candidatus Paceibacterota bacterium]
MQQNKVFLAGDVITSELKGNQLNMRIVTKIEDWKEYTELIFFGAKAIEAREIKAGQNIYVEGKKMTKEKLMVGGGKTFKTIVSVSEFEVIK